jgi:glycerophosphoryl diester phosphodiesterase
MILLDPTARPVIAHRGASGQFPENTLLAFREAVAQGADAVELDVRLTRDGVPVVLHDATLDRTTDGEGDLGRHDFDAIRGLDAGRSEPVPTLQAVLEALPDTPVLVEVKETAATPAVVRVIRDMGAEARVVLGSFESAALKTARAAGLATVATRPETAAFWVASRVGWPFIRMRYLAFSVPEYQGRKRVVDPAFVRLATRTGKPVHVWTVDDPGTALRLRSFGVAGIVTNFPDRMVGLGAGG